MENSEIVAEWIAENRPLIDLWISEATRLFWKDSSVRVPRTAAERRNGMEGWLEKQRLKLGADLQAQIENQSSSLAPGLPASLIPDIFNHSVWPPVKQEVQRYAIFGAVAAWIGRYMGDATTIGVPERHGEQWRVPIGVRGYGDNLGQIVLNAEGEVVPGLTTSRSEILEAIREPALPSLTAAAR